MTNRDLTAAAERLLPCPFCGGAKANARHFNNAWPGVRSFLECVDCGARAPVTDRHKTEAVAEAEAGRSWNRRATVAADEPKGIYVASRASIPDRPKMWRWLRSSGWNITSTWIDEAGEGETADFYELWSRIESEIKASAGLVLFVHGSDFPLKGALVEVGMALGMGKRVAVVLDNVELEPRSMRPLGSWAAHPRCCVFRNLEAAKEWLLNIPLKPSEEQSK